MKVATIKIPFTEEEIQRIQRKMGEALRTGYLTMGKNVVEFEERFADYIGTKYAVGVNTGFSALEICLRGVDVKDSSVIVPTNTSMATPNSVLHAGGKVIFADVLKEDLGMNPDDLKRKIRKNTKAVIPVHIAGIISPRIYEIMEMCKERGIAVIEDAAHAHGATIDGKMAGTLGLAGAFSFYPTKVMTSGEGGIITTNDEEIFKKACSIRDYGRRNLEKVNQYDDFGYNGRLSEFHAIVGVEQIMKADWILKERRKIAKAYDEKLKGLEGIELIKVPKNVESAYYKYVVYLKEGIDREKLKEDIKNEYGIILPAEVYSEHCHSQPVYQQNPRNMINSPKERFPGADFVCGRQICLPLYPGLKEEEADYVVEALEDVLRQ